ncbi:conserved Plasmodium protein, unknown function [Plasmodium malariae]|nr:conserved Plasmodium protein, unknown function [Plasmodium malariae]
MLISENASSTKNIEEKKKIENIMTVEEECIQCEINNKKKNWSNDKLVKELTQLNHDIICLNKYQHHPFKKSCQASFSFLKQGEKYYTSSEKLQKRNYRLIFENLKSSPSVQISLCGILMTIIVGLVDLKNRKFKSP